MLVKSSCADTDYLVAIDHYGLKECNVWYITIMSVVRLWNLHSYKYVFNCK